MNEALYANQGKEDSGWITSQLILSLAADMGIDGKKLATDANSKAVTIGTPVVRQGGVGIRHLRDAVVRDSSPACGAHAAEREHARTGGVRGCAHGRDRLSQKLR